MTPIVINQYLVLPDSAIARIDGKLDSILRAVLSSTRQEEQSMGRMEDAVNRMKAAVEKNTEVDGSAKALLEGIAQQLRDLKNDPAAIEALAAQLEGDNAGLAAAVSANTPADSTGGTGGTTGGDTGGTGGTGGTGEVGGAQPA